MGILEILIVVILLLWVTGGFIFPVGTSLIHLLLVIVAIIIVIRLLQGRSVL
jgi:hypothetical protein